MERFLEAQNQNYEGYEMALEEMRSGRKESHWIWYIFPQLAVLGYSWNAKYYGISDLEEAREYVEHPILRDRLIEISEVVLHSDVSDVEVLMNGHTDAIKLQSSMTLFAIAAPEIEVFEQVLEKYFGGKMDGKTVDMVKI